MDILAVSYQFITIIMSGAFQLHRHLFKLFLQIQKFRPYPCQQIIESREKKHYNWPQKELNVLQRTRLSCGYIMRLLAHPHPPTPVSKLSLFSVFLCMCVAGRAYWWERGSGGWARRKIIRPRESLSFYKSFNSPCLVILVRYLSVSVCPLATRINIYSVHFTNSSLIASMRTLNSRRTVIKTACGSVTGDEKSTKGH